MKTITSEIKDFYFYYHTRAEISSEKVIKTSLCTRSDFVMATFDALVFLIQDVCRAFFASIALVFTLGLNPSYRALLCYNLYEGVVHMGSIPVSLCGIISPQKVNECFLKITPIERRGEIKEVQVKNVVDILGTIVLRKRRPLCSQSDSSSHQTCAN